MIELDNTVEKLERNFQHGYEHVDTSGKHWKALQADDIIDALDATLSRTAINDASVFLRLLYQIIAHQTYHQPVDEDSGISYSRIVTMLKEGKGNPRLHKLEDLLTAVGASMVICRVADRENDIAHAQLPRACFFQHLVPEKERWPFRETIDLLFAHGLQFRIFSLEDSKLHNALKHEADVDVNTDSKSTRPRDANKSTRDVLSLLKFFNVNASMRFTIKPPK